MNLKIRKEKTYVKQQFHNKFKKMLKNIINSIIKIPSTRLFVTAPSTSIVTQSSSLSNALERYKSPLITEPREVWLENLDTEETQRLGLMSLHPEVFADTPRIDIVQRNIQWQRMYQFVSFAHTKTRAEKRGGGTYVYSIYSSSIIFD